MLIGADGAPHYGQIQEDGSFTVAGVPVGEVRATVASPNPGSASGRGGNIRRADPETGRGIAGGSVRSGDYGVPAVHNWFRVPDRYADLETSGLSLIIVPGTNHFDVVLEEQK
jgi:hypothetical protein